MFGCAIIRPLTMPSLRLLAQRVPRQREPFLADVLCAKCQDGKQRNRGQSPVGGYADLRAIRVILSYCSTLPCARARTTTKTLCAA